LLCEWDNFRGIDRVFETAGNRGLWVLVARFWRFRLQIIWKMSGFLLIGRGRKGSLDFLGYAHKCCINFRGSELGKEVGLYHAQLGNRRFLFLRIGSLELTPKRILNPSSSAALRSGGNSCSAMKSEAKKSGLTNSTATRAFPNAAANLIAPLISGLDLLVVPNNNQALSN
jgi:hypothetical protein